MMQEESYLFLDPLTFELYLCSNISKIRHQEGYHIILCSVVVEEKILIKLKTILLLALAYDLSHPKVVVVKKGRTCVSFNTISVTTLIESISTISIVLVCH